LDFLELEADFESFLSVDPRRSFNPGLSTLLFVLCCLLSPLPCGLTSKDGASRLSCFRVSCVCLNSSFVDWFFVSELEGVLFRCDGVLVVLSVDDPVELYFIDETVLSCNGFSNP